MCSCCARQWLVGDPDVAGKVSRLFLEQKLFPTLLGTEELLWGPRPGGDFGAVALDETRALVMATDPLAVSPELGWERSAWLAFHLITVDAALSGIHPAYLTASWAMPEHMSEDALGEVLTAFHLQAQEYGVQVVTGHTARYHGVSFPWVGAATAIGVGRQSELRLPSLARPGDALLLWGTPGLEAAVLLALTQPGQTRPELSRWAEENFFQLSALDVTLNAAPLPGVRCMHDVTEGGLLGAVAELASAMGRGVKLDWDSLESDAQVWELLQPVELSPWEVTSCGSVLAVVSPRAATQLVQQGFRQVGVVRTSPNSVVVNRGRTTPLRAPEHDGFWDVYADRGAHKEGQ